MIGAVCAIDDVVPALGEALRKAARGALIEENVRHEVCPQCSGPARPLLKSILTTHCRVVTEIAGPRVADSCWLGAARPFFRLRQGMLRPPALALKKLCVTADATGEGRAEASVTGARYKAGRPSYIGSVRRISAVDGLVEAVPEGKRPSYDGADVNALLAEQDRTHKPKQKPNANGTDYVRLHRGLLDRFSPRRAEYVDHLRR